MQFTSFDEMKTWIIKSKKKKRIVIAGADEEEVMLAQMATECGLAEFTLLGDAEKIQKLVAKYDKGNHANTDNAGSTGNSAKTMANNMANGTSMATTCKIIGTSNDTESARQAVALVKAGEADIPMKGLIHTATFMRAVLNKETGLTPIRRISQITIFENPALTDIAHSDDSTAHSNSEDGYLDAGNSNRADAGNEYADNGLRYLTDCAINVDTTSIAVKTDIIKNAVHLAQVYGTPCPRVALLGAVETVSEKMPDTVQSAVLTQMNRRGQIGGCIIDGPLSLDNAISAEACARKGISSPIDGNADILVGSSLQESNTLSKSLHFYANFNTASVIIGTIEPYIMTSRTDAIENKINSIAATCCYLMNRDNNQ
ncbi:MAG: hypothetical protein LBN22_11400 [Clostridiales Family XIII bacterium]|nr:hypothetical protein [Clostridiales Family XIII bacterium]